MKILVRNLARTTTEEEIHNLFSTHGLLTECTLVMDRETGSSKGFGFVEMPNDAEAEAAISSLDQTVLAKKKIRVKQAD